MSVLICHITSLLTWVENVWHQRKKMVTVWIHFEKAVSQEWMLAITWMIMLGAQMISTIVMEVRGNLMSSKVEVLKLYKHSISRNNLASVCQSCPSVDGPCESWWWLEVVVFLQMQSLKEGNMNTFQSYSMYWLYFISRWLILSSLKSNAMWCQYEVAN